MGKGMEKENGSGNKIGECAENSGKSGDGVIGRIEVNSKRSDDSISKVESESPMIFENLVWMSSAEAARYLRKSYGALRVMVCRGHIKPRMFRRRWYFKRIELDRLIENSI